MAIVSCYIVLLSPCCYLNHSVDDLIIPAIFLFILNCSPTISRIAFAIKTPKIIPAQFLQAYCQQQDLIIL